MGRKIERCTREVTPITVNITKDLGDWLVENAPETAVTLLAFALDGLIWGTVKAGKLMIAHEYSVLLRADTLQEARLFSETAELHIWRSGDTLQAQTVIDDLDGKDNEYIDESQILWGDNAKAIDEGEFTLMSDGVQGLFHAVPLPLTIIPTQKEGGCRPLRLQVRHYLVDDEFGQARIAFSRLVELTAVGQEASS